MKKRLCYGLAILCFITICDADEHHYSNYHESNPLKDKLKDVEIQITFETNKFSNDGSPIPCKVSLKITGNEENLKNSKWLGSRRPLIGLSSITTEEDQETGLWFELLNSSGEKVPLANNRLDACDCIIENREWKTIFYDLTRIFKISDVGEYKIRVFYELHIDEGSQTPEGSEEVKSTHYKDSVFSDWATFDIVDNSKERDAKIKVYRDAFQSGDKKKVLEYLERLEKDTTFEIVKIMSGDLFALTKNTDKAVSEKASRPLLEITKDGELLALLKKDDELLNRIMKIASSSEFPDLRLLASKSIERTQIHGDFYIKDIPMWFAKEKEDTVRSALISNVYNKNVLLDAIKNSDNIQIKVTSFKNLVRIGDKDLAVKTAEQMQTDITPVKYDGQDTTVGAVMNLQIKKLRDMEAEVIKEGSDLSDMYRSY